MAKEQAEKLAAVDALAHLQSSAAVAKALDEAKASLTEALKNAGVSSLDDVIARLVAVEDLRAERDRLKQQVEDLDAKLTTLTEIERKLQQAKDASKTEVAMEEIESALVLQQEVREALAPVRQTSGDVPGRDEPTKTDGSKTEERKQILEDVKQAIAAASELKKQLNEHLNQKLTPGEERRMVEELVLAAKRLEELKKGRANPEVIKKENSDLRGQVAFLKNRLNARGGRDYPPCWADENGKVEFLFTVELRPESVSVLPAWAPRREESARSLPGIDGALSGPHSTRAFIGSIQEIFHWSKKQDPECRHFVYLKSYIEDAVQSDRARLMVENYFYKVEARR
ncbi:hypothetical protein [Aromatoleum aromaticum]|uniref:hypothetical protein n=1 Tax=Aromatoleum aromaticum TaxID=551760 RepID=UPI001459C9A5|nr:hypothetical protein [Aromatoleum aromaticum]NMG56496.1 hypothetical protein [Aromatoleum aromaticum]